MGCLCSHGATEGEVTNNPRTFKVINVDDRGEERNPGRIEITESELVWYQRGREPIRWPLKSLRRYGFDAELFSFESGRRCPTGPGIYAFKCRRAEALFNLLQESIQRQRTGQEETVATNPTRTMNAELIGSSNRQSRPNSSEVIGTTTVAAGADLMVSPLYINGDIGRHEYINTEVAPAGGITVSRQDSLDAVTLSVPPTPSSGLLTPGATAGEHIIQYAELDLPKTTDSADTSPSHDVTVNTAAQQAMYMNVPKTIANGTKPANGSTRLYTPRDESARAAKTNGSKVNYIQLDHRGESSATVATASVLNQSVTPESPSRSAKSDTYARIDIERTQALNHRRISTDDDCSRKTRHNSNIEELYGASTESTAATNGNATLDNSHR